MDDDTSKQLAFLMGNVCVRNTIIENYHANNQLDDDDMKKLKKEMVNKLYTFMKLRDYSLEHDESVKFMPQGWDEPKEDNGLAGVVDPDDPRKPD